MGAIFTYEFPQAIGNFKEKNVSLFTLCNYSVLLEHALDTGYINDAQLTSLKRWREDPSSWGKKR
jgi:orotate phosphoribosyltransferase